MKPSDKAAELEVKLSSTKHQSVEFQFNELFLNKRDKEKQENLSKPYGVEK